MLEGRGRDPLVAPLIYIIYLDLCDGNHCDERGTERCIGNEETASYECKCRPTFSGKYCQIKGLLKRILKYNTIKGDLSLP